jgi:Alpha/beta hydrolase domain
MSHLSSIAPSKPLRHRLPRGAAPTRNAACLVAVLAAWGAVLLSPLHAWADVSVIQVESREPLAAGTSFGGVGAYEKIRGRFFGELDPSDPLNAGIVDLDKAPRNDRGRVEYSSDFVLIKPVDLSKGNATLLYDVNNRGNLRALQQFNSAPNNNNPSTPDDMGNGFLMRNGYAVTWSGWLNDIEPGKGLRLNVPVAKNGTKAIEGDVWDEIVFNGKPATEAHLTFQAASTAKTKATLLIRATSAGPAKMVPAAQWEFVDAHTIRLLPAGTAFQRGLIYQFVYHAVDPPVSGIGFAATRDWVSFLRNREADAIGQPNPLAPNGKPSVQFTLAHGTSQSGRYLRDFLYRGFNEDEQHRRVFDGMNVHIATARVFLDYRFSEANQGFHPGGYASLFYPDVSFPFAYETQTDSLTGRTDGLLERCSARNNCPKIIHTISATEYWFSSESLVQTDTLGQHDTTPPDSVRIYFIAGTEHLGGRGAANAPGFCQEPYNSVDATPVLRVALQHLQRWVKDGTAPPPSQYPTLKDGTLVPGNRAGFPAVPGVNWPATALPRPIFDYGPNFAKGILTKVLPGVSTRSYPTLVPKVDADGNETSGIRLPDVAVPLATVTGWALRAKDLPAAGELCFLDGSRIPFAKTQAERQAAGDPRLSLQERYTTPADYVSKVEAAATALAKQGYLLDEDVERIVAKAKTVVF